MTSEEFKKALWEAADKLRGSVAAAKYKYPVPGPVFLKYVSDIFDTQAGVIRKRLAEPKFNEGGNYADEPGFCFSASLADVEKQRFRAHAGTLRGRKTRRKMTTKPSTKRCGG